MSTIAGERAAGAASDNAIDVAQLYERAAEHTRQRRFAAAVNLLGRVLEDDPRHLSALDLLGFVCFSEGRYAAAEEQCRRALAISPRHAYALKGLGLCLASQGQLDEGVASLRRAILVDPGWYDPYWDLAVVLHEGGRDEEALVVLALALEVAPQQRDEVAGFVARIEQRRPRPARRWPWP